MVEILKMLTPEPEESNDPHYGNIAIPTTYYSSTPELMDFIEGVPQLQDLRKKLLKEPLLDGEDLQRICKELRPSKSAVQLSGKDLDEALDKMIGSGEKFDVVSDDPCLHELLANTSLVLPKNPLLIRSPELVARLERLRFEQAEVAYKAMTKNVATKRYIKEDTIGYQLNQMNRQLIAVGQVILSVGAGFAFGFLGVPLLIGGMDFGLRILLGMAVAIIIAIAELYFLGKYLVAEDIMDDEQKSPRKKHKD